MFQSKTLAVLLLGTLHCSAALLPVQYNEVSEPHARRGTDVEFATLQARNADVDLAILEAREADNDLATLDAREANNHVITREAREANNEPLKLDARDLAALQERNAAVVPTLKARHPEIDFELLQKRIPEADLVKMSDHELEGIKYAMQGDFKRYAENARQAAHMSGDADLIRDLYPPSRLRRRAYSSYCARGRTFHIKPKYANKCWNATYYQSRRDRHANVINSCKRILYQRGAVRRSAAKAGAIFLLPKARALDKENQRLWAREAEAEVEARNALSTGSEVEPYVEQRGVDVVEDSSAELDKRGFLGINWHFLDGIAHFVSLIATVFVAVTVCAEPVLEPPGFMLLAAVVWTLCGSLVAEILPAVVDTVGYFRG